MKALITCVALLVSLGLAEAADLVDRTFEMPRGKMRITEVSRTGRISRLRVQEPKQKIMSAVGSSMTIAFVCAEIARAQQCAYLVVLDDDGEGNLVLGVTNHAHPNIKKEFGAQYSPRLEGEPRPVMSVKEIDAVSKPPHR
jgi:hypothetical protein